MDRPAGNPTSDTSSGVTSGRRPTAPRSAASPAGDFSFLIFLLLGLFTLAPGSGFLTAKEEEEEEEDEKKKGGHVGEGSQLSPPWAAMSEKKKKKKKKKKEEGGHGGEGG